MLRYEGLIEQNWTFGGNAGSDQAGGHFTGAGAQRFRVLRDGDGMQIDDAINRLKTIRMMDSNLINQILD